MDLKILKTQIKKMLYSHKNGKRKCIVCGSNLDSFLPGGVRSEVFEKYSVIGGGYRENYYCPICGAIDRERWQYYVFSRVVNENIKGKILHFAPERSIRSALERKENVDYYSCDLNRKDADYIVDITDIPFKDAFFDIVISNHVLEHIVEEEKAVSEVRRVLKSRGKWFFSFPYTNDICTLEDKNDLSPEVRLQKYGQSDHVRLYGKDCVAHFEKYGLTIKQYLACEICSEEEIERYGLIRGDLILVACKE